MDEAVERRPIESSRLAAVGYSQEHGVLEVEFRSGRVYRYFAVPAKVYEGLLKADSKGAYLNRFVRNVYPFEVF
jgi:KTSC domain